MRTRLIPEAPPALAMLAVLLLLCAILNREASIKEGLPIFFPVEQSFIHVELTGDVLVSGVYQIYDGLSLSSVMDLTEVLQAESLSDDPAWSQLLQGGESFRIFKKDQKIEIIHRGWMSANHRVAVGIPLHPDRMSIDDWTFLPGIGAALAERIENDRQKNGDFGRLGELVRVKGVGRKRISKWNEFFDDV